MLFGSHTVNTPSNSLALLEQELLGNVQRLFRRGLQVLVRTDDGNAREFLSQRFQVAAFALLGAFAPRIVAQQGDVPLAAEHFTQLASRQHTAVIIVRGDVADVGLGIVQAAVKNNRRDAGCLGFLNRIDQGLRVERGHNDAAYSLGNKALHDVDLPLAVVLLQGAFPDDAGVASLLRSLLGAGMNRFPELVRRPLGNDGNPVLDAVARLAATGSTVFRVTVAGSAIPGRLLAAGGEQTRQHQYEEPAHFNSPPGHLKLSQSCVANRRRAGSVSRGYASRDYDERPLPRPQLPRPRRGDEPALGFFARASILAATMKPIPSSQVGMPRCP